jgi:hypothetical protein
MLTIVFAWRGVTASVDERSRRSAWKRAVRAEQIGELVLSSATALPVCAVAGLPAALCSLEGRHVWWQ